MGIEEPRVVDMRQSCPADMEPVPAGALAMAIGDEAAARDADRHRRIVGRRGSVLVVDEPRVLDGEVAALGADAGAVAIRYSGALDQIVPVAMGRAVHDAAPDPKALWIAPRAGHVDLVEVGAIEAAARFVARIDRSLPGAS